MNYLDPLNPEQRRAVLHTGSPGGSLLILAGAGSGKTRVITTKIAYLIREQGLDPRSILAVTFTNKAAREMAERAKAIEPGAEGAMLRTFHSFGAWFLRRNGKYAELNSSFVIYNDDDVISLLASLMPDDERSDVKKFAHKISRAKDYFLSPEDPLLAMIDGSKKFRRIYTKYEERMAQIGNVDFGDLIKKPVEILRNQPEVAVRFQDRFKVIMVDEYQDANVAQFCLLKELCGQDTYVCVVGDDDQSIYKFRGAEVKNILEFPDRFSDTEIIKLESNYRSTAPILKAASSVVDCNSGRLGKTLRAEKGNGPLPALVYLPDQDEEANFCAQKIQSSVNKGEANYSDWAILYRTNAQSLGFETHFLRKGIPYKVVGSLKFYEREEIRDALALLALIVNPRDEVAFRRVVNKPPRGIGVVTVNKIVDAALISGGNLLEAGKDLDLSTKAEKGLKEFINVIEEGKNLLENSSNEEKNIVYPAVLKITDKKEVKIKKQAELAAQEGLSVCIHKLLQDSGLAKYHREQDEIAGNSKTQNLQALLNGAIDYAPNIEGLLNFLEDIELDRTREEESELKNTDINNTVTLITVHNTKGLEFKRVIITGLEQGIFPRDDKKDEELEEERRLFYVGATRAEDELYLTSCEMRKMYGRVMPSRPSLFLEEIDKSILQIFDKRKHGYGAHSAGGHFNNTALYGTGNRSYNVYNLNKADTHSHFKRQITSSSKGSKEIEQKLLEERAGYKKGDRILHEHHGYGAVIKITEGDEGPLVFVKFDSGKEVFFNSEKYGRAYEKIGDDN